MPPGRRGVRRHGNALRAIGRMAPPRPSCPAEIGVSSVPGDRRRAKSAERPVPDGRNAGAAEEPRRDLDAWDFWPTRFRRSRCRGWISWVSRAGAGRRSRAIRAHPQFGKTIFLDTAASDDALAHAFARPIRCFIPSLAEGFGLPPHEALDARIAPDLRGSSVLRSGLGADAVYVDPTDVYSWGGNDKKTDFGQIGRTKRTVREEARMAGSFRTGCRSIG
jgi:hypothetical protein